MNAKTWQTLCGLAAYPFAAAVVVSFLKVSHPVLILFGNIFNIFFITLCAVGACMGVMFCLRRLHLGCPFCHARSRVVGGAGRQIFVECPSCGTVQVTCRFFRTATAEKIGDCEE